jgi:NADPH:quinone reductase-like Zn-dependent oxidoreductase
VGSSAWPELSETNGPSISSHPWIPTAVYLTVYAGESEDFMRAPLNELAQQIKAGALRVQVGKTVHLDEILLAHRLMKENKAGGKIVVLT